MSFPLHLVEGCLARVNKDKIESAYIAGTCLRSVTDIPASRHRHADIGRSGCAIPTAVCSMSPGISSRRRTLCSVTSVERRCQRRRAKSISSIPLREHAILVRSEPMGALYIGDWRWCWFVRRRGTIGWPVSTKLAVLLAAMRTSAACRRLP